MGRDKCGNVLLLEFKRRRASLSCASQLDRYVSYLSASIAPKRKEKVRGGLVAPSITKETLALLNEKGYDFFKLKAEA